MRILVTGSGGLLGSCITRCLEGEHEVIRPSRTELDLRDSEKTLKFVENCLPDMVIHCAAKVGGISANIEFPADYILENSQIDSSILAASRSNSVNSLIYFGSSCMYPKDFRQPLQEGDLFAGPLEETNMEYAVAKLAGAITTTSVAKQDGLAWRVLLLSNLYGPGDNFSENDSHLIAAIIRKFAKAKDDENQEIEIWGSGESRREFTFVEDVAKFISTEIKNVSNWPEMMNLGAGKDYSIIEYYQLVADIFNVSPKFVFDLTRPEGMQKKLMDSNLAMSVGWRPETQMLDGLAKTVSWYLEKKQ
jgi:GDP-L-fucose synthase